MKTDHCINCRNVDLKPFIDLGSQPNGNDYPTWNARTDERKYPCIMLVCQHCWQVQLEEFPSAEEMFSNHPYITGLNKPVVDHLEVLAKDIVAKISLPEDSLVLDIGANDGTLMGKFQDIGMRVIGMDPCRSVQRISQANGLNVLQEFWNEDTAKKMKAQDLVPDVITATAVFYHVDDLHGFIRGLVTLMHAETVFCVQSVYLKDIIQKAQFDHFYHEHIMIHSIGPLKRAFAEHGLHIFDVEFYPVHGGSFVLYVSKEGSRFPVSSRVSTALEEERESGLYDLSTYLTFSDVVNQNKEALLSLLRKLKADGASVFGLGAPVKGNTLLNFYGIDAELVKCLTEINPEKIGRYAPGSHIPVVDETTLVVQPDYYLVLSWNYLDYLEEKYCEYLQLGGQFIIPHPEVTVISKSGRKSLAW